MKLRTNWGLKDHHANLQCKEIYCVLEGLVHIFPQFSWLCTKITRCLKTEKQTNAEHLDRVRHGSLIVAGTCHSLGP